LKNQATLLEVKGYIELTDVLQWHANDYITDSAANGEKGQALYAASGCIAAVTSKNSN
jgi:hypothetical protein